MAVADIAKTGATAPIELFSARVVSFPALLFSIFLRLFFEFCAVASTTWPFLFAVLYFMQQKRNIPCLLNIGCRNPPIRLQF